MGQLGAALFRPQTGYYADLVADTAALWESLSQNHPFVDRNKRAAFAGMPTFLLINGSRLDTTHEVGWNFLSGLYDGHRLKFEALEAWLRQYAEPGS